MKLVGAEEVSRAGYNMQSAAAEMLRAANLINEAVYMQKSQLDRLEQILMQNTEGKP